MPALREKIAWKALEAHFEKTKDTPLREFFDTDPKRGEDLVAKACGIYLDYSKNRINRETLPLLANLARECHLRERIDAMFAGEAINQTENRAVLHVALRAPEDASFVTGGKSVMPQIHDVLR